MERRSESEEHLEVFGGEYEAALLGFLEVLGELGPEPASPDPLSLGMEDGRTFEELSDDEMEMLKKILYEQLGIDEQDENLVIRQYETEGAEEASVPGKIEVRVLGTNKEGVFLQELTFSDGKIRWVVGSDQDI